jgi:hypothetical protein
MERMWPTRLRMADAIDLVGPPDGSPVREELSYWLGSERGWIRIDGETLDLDADGRVRSCYATVH